MVKSICPACESNSIRQVLDIDITRHHQQYASNDAQVLSRLDSLLHQSATKYLLCKCDDCLLEFSDPMRAPGAEWYELTYRLLNLFPESRWEFNVVADRISRRDSVLEIGCGIGKFLERCQTRGVSARGVDLSREAVAECLSKGFEAEVHDACKPLREVFGCKHNVVAAFHVLEHLDNPENFFCETRNAVDSRGRLFLSVPSYLRPSRCFGNRDFMDEPPHHMTRWTRQAFDAIGSRTGWKLEQIIFEPISLRVAIWNISVNTEFYRRFKALGGCSSRLLERVARHALFPYSAAQRMAIHRNMTGFSMLACFVRSE